MRWLTGILIGLLLAPAPALAATDVTFNSEAGDSIGEGKNNRVDSGPLDF